MSFPNYPPFLNENKLPYIVKLVMNLEGEEIDSNIMYILLLDLYHHKKKQ